MMTESLRSQIPGPKICLLGDSGTGKTYSLRTLVDAGLHVRCVFTEASMETVSDLPPDKLTWKYVSPIATSWKELRVMSNNVNKFDYDNLTKIADPNKQKHQAWIQLLTSLEEYVDDRTGTNYGAVDDWGTGVVLAIDGLSGLSLMAMQNTVGGKVVRGQNEWQVAQNLVEQFVMNLCVGLRCPVVLIAHEEREANEITGGSTVTVSTLGKKLAPKLPRWFSDILMTKRNADKFTWSSTASGASVKTRLLALRDDLPPSFVPLFAEWKKRGGVFEEVNHGKAA